MKNAEKNGECKKAWLKTHQKSVKMVYDVPIFCGVYSGEDEEEEPGLQHVTIPDTVRELGSAAFAECNKLEGIELPEGLKTIGYSAFAGCTSLTTPPVLPATTLDNGCYEYMFYYCTGLKNAPKLPATTLANYCYYCMFYGCTSLKTAPELPATTLATRCYLSMFQGCSSLKTAPELPATTLATRCYYTMFYKCSGLETAPVLPATTLAEKCYSGMFMYCPKLSSVSCKATSGMNTTNLAFWLDYAGSDATSPTLHVTNGKKLEEWNLPSSVTWTVVDDL